MSLSRAFCLIALAGFWFGWSAPVHAQLEDVDVPDVSGQGKAAAPCKQTSVGGACIDAPKRYPSDEETYEAYKRQGIPDDEARRRARGLIDPPERPLPPLPTYETGAGAAGTCAAGIAAPRGTFCDSIEECRRFCNCACSYGKDPWEEFRCSRIPTGGWGMLPRDSSQMSIVPKLPHISSNGKVRAAEIAIEGLSRLSDALEVSENRKKYGYTVRIVNCWRSHVGDSERECKHVLIGEYLLTKNRGTEEDGEKWRVLQDPNQAGLAWPGRTPHSGGYACDLVLVDSNGKDCHDCRAGVNAGPTCSIDQKLASRMLDQELDRSGAVRLRYEAWHYEWTPDPPKNRCKAGECQAKYWPLKCTPP